MVLLECKGKLVKVFLRQLSRVGEKNAGIFVIIMEKMMSVFFREIAEIEKVCLVEYYFIRAEYGRCIH